MDKSEQILEMIAKMNFDINNQFFDINNRMQEGFEAINFEINGMNSEIKGITSEVNGMKSEINGINSEIKGITSEVKGIKSDIIDIKTTIENVTNKNIKIIAEGHRDLNNKLDNALKVENEKELLLIRLTVLENEVNRIKARLEEIA